jgi:hypothetical protein
LPNLPNLPNKNKKGASIVGNTGEEEVRKKGGQGQVGQGFRGWTLFLISSYSLSVLYSVKEFRRSANFSGW